MSRRPRRLAYEEAAAAAESLQDQASSLVKVVSVFKLNEGHVVAPAHPTINVTPPVVKITATKRPTNAPARIKMVANGASSANGEDWEQF